MASAKYHSNSLEKSLQWSESELDLVMAISCVSPNIPWDGCLIVAFELRLVKDVEVFLVFEQCSTSAQDSEKISALLCS